MMIKSNANKAEPLILMILSPGNGYKASFSWRDSNAQRMKSICFCNPVKRENKTLDWVVMKYFDTNVALFKNIGTSVGISVDVSHRMQYLFLKNIKF